MRLTVDSVMSLKPCSEWSRERVTEYFGGRRYVLHTTVLRDASIDIDDRLWLAIQLMSARDQRIFACDCAERALTRERNAGREPDARFWEAVAVSRRYAAGEATVDELAAALAAAASAWLAARAARAAAEAAAWDAAWFSAWFSAWAAARAARAAAEAAAWVAEREWQLGRAIEYLEGK